ncbi:CDP-glycerol glycerophosphotransferase family protein [Isoptericola variabilis]|uniref:CDP-glycerol glycerophosphotransferase family protein n=1 Tax=Isoptericola variabilis TaxID=139208 RepID=UPI003D18FE9E
MRSAIHRLVSRMVPRRTPRSSARQIDWSAAGVRARHGAVHLDVQLPAEAAVVEASLVLAARVGAHEVLVPFVVDADVARARISGEQLASLGTTVLDAWVEAVAEHGKVMRHRVGVDRGQLDRDLDAASSTHARWYATTKGNLSVDVTSSGAGVVTAEVLCVDETASTVTVSLAARGSAADEHAVVFRGRKDGRAVTVPLTAWEMQVARDELFVLGPQRVDVFLARAGSGGGSLRERVVADSALDLAPGSQGLWRWESDGRGHLTLRRTTPVEAIAASGIFDEEFYRAQVPGLPDGVDPIEHYVARGAAESLDPSPMFDTSYYLQKNPTVRRVNPLAHYCEFGWRELRNPSASFDTWWYWSKHLDLADESVNPLSHYAATGRAAGLSTRPSRVPSRVLGRGHQFVPGQAVRRVCLFAAYDADGTVDDYVVEYVRELSRFADVYYLADSEMSDDELAKLSEITVGAWADRHGEYDFGSYKRLAERVGWETLETYDEMLLVNDSCYLLRRLDEVFARMDARAADWWGLQATKGLARDRRAAQSLFREPIPMDSVRYSALDRFEEDYTYDFHVASYFLAYRAPVIRDPEFRRYLGSVTGQSNKLNIVRKYEIGLTRWLVQHSHPFDTFVDHLYPFHPIFTEWYFRLLDEGFPLLKRFFLSENHYHVPRLKDWKERVLAKAPGADVESFERNLVRVTDPDKLRASLWIGTEQGVEDAPVPDEILTRAEFVAADRLSPKHANWWAFPVCAFTENFSGNERAMFEQVKNDPTIRKVVLTRGKEVVVDGVNVDVVALESAEGQHLLMRCGVILVKHNLAVNAVHPVSAELHNVIQVWHGVPFKRIAYASEDFKHMLDRAATEQAQYRAVIASSRTDSLAMAASFFPLTIAQVWNTGLPRNDFILQDEQDLAPDMVAELAKLRALVGERRLVLFMPTFRNAQAEGYYQFEDHELEWLAGWLEENDGVLGVREHMADTARVYGSQLAALPVIDLSDAEFVHPELLYRVADLLITDYSSTFIDYMLTGKPAVSFAFDLESYEVERGGFYDLDQVFPGPIARDFGELQEALTGIFEREVDPTYALKRALLHDHLDGQSAHRVVERVRELGEVQGLGTWPGQRVA